MWLIKAFLCTVVVSCLGGKQDGTARKEGSSWYNHYKDRQFFAVNLRQTEGKVGINLFIMSVKAVSLQSARPTVLNAMAVERECFINVHEVG